MCTGRLVDCGPVRNSAKLMSENEMMKAKIAPETRLDRNSGNVTMSRDRDAGGGLGGRLINAAEIAAARGIDCLNTICRTQPLEEAGFELAVPS